MDHDRWAVGFVVGLDYWNPTTDPHGLFQAYKRHPFVAASWTEDRSSPTARRRFRKAATTAFRASPGRAASSAATGVAPQLAAAEGRPHGDEIGNARRGDRVRRPGAGRLSARGPARLRQARSRVLDPRRAMRSSEFPPRLRARAVDGDVRRRTSARHGRDRALGNRPMWKPGPSHMKKLSETGVAPVSLEETQRRYDNVHTFTKVNDVFHSGTKHDEDQPCHLLVSDTDSARPAARRSTETPASTSAPRTSTRWSRCQAGRAEAEAQPLELRPLQDLRHRRSLPDHHVGPARGRRRPELHPALVRGKRRERRSPPGNGAP